MKTAFKNIDEVVFEGRNKSYGAFFLRANNNKFVSIALSIAVIAISAATIIPFLLFKEASSNNVEKSVGAEFANMEAPKTDEEAPPPPPPPPPPEVMEQKVKFTAPIITADTVEDTGLLNQDELNQQSTNTSIDINPVETNEIVVEEVENKVIEQAPPPPFTFVEVMPRFEGGDEAMYAYIYSNIVYPQIAKETGISGTVVVTFVVEKDGSITEVTLLKDIGGGCGDEAIRLIKAMPKWIPGKQNGIPVSVQFCLPIKFELL